ncbi:MAG TPA: hypothetical protein VIV54_21770, partial [Burkholderiales bacterium]
SSARSLQNRSQVKDTNVEALLLRERRAALPLARQFLLYLDPFALFKDASTGTFLVRESAIAYNRAMRWMLLPYIRRWLMIAASLFLAIAPAEAMAAQTRIFLIPAAFAVGCCIAVTVTAVIVAVYLLLGSGKH